MSDGMQMARHGSTLTGELYDDDKNLVAETALFLAATASMYELATALPRGWAFQLNRNAGTSRQICE
jgi:hypothetical protein